MRRTLAICSLALAAGSVLPASAAAQGVDFTFFVGRAYPIYDDRLTLRPGLPVLPGVEVTSAESFEVSTDGGLVFGGAVGFEFGILALEGRLDATEIGFDTTAARYDLRATQPPFTGLTGSIALGAGRFDAERLYLLSGNVRLRTPGPVALVASGGVSLLPDISIAGSAPVSLQVAGIPIIPGLEPRLRLRAAPGESEHRIGINGGAGLRVGAGRLALVAEARAFYFREYQLRFAVDDADEIVTALLNNLDPVRFEPVIVNAQVGVVVRF